MRGPGDEQLDDIEDFVVNEYDVVTSAPPQDVRAALAAIPVRDMAESEIWYSSLLGREPDSRPMDGLVEWRPTTSSNTTGDRSGSVRWGRNPAGG